MASINISDLRPASSEIVMDSDSFFNDLGNDEMSNVKGGIACLLILKAAICLIEALS